MANPDLPAFGIRDLNGPACPPGIVQITASQYDGTIHSQPDAVLSYIDHDDGELITVGSSFELQQRLEEPIPPSASPVPSFARRMAPVKAARAAKENSLVHIFDIRQTSGSLAVWRDHEAYTTKKLRDQESSSSSSRSGTRVSSPQEPSSSGSQPRLAIDTLENSVGQDTLDKTSTVPPPSALVSDPTTANDGNPNHTSAAQPVISGEAQPLSQMHKAPSNAFARFESHLGPLADFLESTAQGLRKLAEKTAGADTSPVENVLSGFKNIMKEAGELGLDLLATIVDQEMEKNRSNGVDTASEAGPPSEAQLSSLPSSPTKTSGGEDKQMPDVHPEARFGFVESRINSFTTTDGPFPDTQAVRLSRSAGVPGQSSGEDKVRPDIQSSEKRVSFVETPLIEPSQMKLKPAASEPLKKDRSSSEVQTSSLLSSVSPTSTQRQSYSPYSMSNLLSPPLPSRYVTGGRTESAGTSIIDSQPSYSDALTRFPALKSLRNSASTNRFEEALALASSFQHGLSTKSALSRYPSIGQFEEQSRANPPIDLDSKKHSDGHCEDLVGPLARPVPKKPNVYKKPTVDEEEPARSQPTESAGQTKAPDIPDVFTWPSYPIPGAWFQPKSEQQSEPKREDPLRKELTTTAGTSKTSQDMPQWQPEGRSSIFGGPSQRPTSPDGMTYPRGPAFPRKSQTVSGTNPAARLSRPFNPLAYTPVLQPRPQRSQPDLSASKVGFLNTRVSPGLPGPLPRRSQTLHYTDRYKPRDIAPYQNPRSNSWEDYLKDRRSTTTNPRTAYHHSRTLFSDEPDYRPDLLTPFGPPAPPAPRPPFVPAQGPARPLNRTQPAADQSKPLRTVRSSASTPQLLGTLRPETIQVGPPQVRAASKPSPPAIPAPPPAAVHLPPAPAAANVSRSSSIRYPFPPAPPRPRGRLGIPPPTSASSQTVDECVKALKAMGFGGDDPNELARLNVYAGAAEGDVEIAIQLLEEDRAAAKELGKREHTEANKDLEKEADVEKNPWEE